MGGLLTMGNIAATVKIDELVELVVKCLGRMQLADELSQTASYNPDNPLDPLMFGLISLYSLHECVPFLEAGSRYVNDGAFVSSALKWARGISADGEKRRLESLLDGSPAPLKNMAELFLHAFEMPERNLELMETEEIEEISRKIDERRELAAGIGKEMGAVPGKQLRVFTGIRNTDALYCRLKKHRKYSENLDETFTLGFGYCFNAYYDKESGEIFIRPASIDFEFGLLNAMIGKGPDGSKYRRKGIEVAREIWGEISDYERFCRNSSRLALLHELGEKMGHQIVEKNERTEFTDIKDHGKRGVANTLFYSNPSGNELHADLYLLRRLNGDGMLAKFKLFRYLMRHPETADYSDIMIYCLMQENPAGELTRILGNIRQHVGKGNPFAEYEQEHRQKVVQLL